MGWTGLEWLQEGPEQPRIAPIMKSGDKMLFLIKSSYKSKGMDTAGFDTCNAAGIIVPTPAVGNNPHE
jgi:hypothetical protein